MSAMAVKSNFNLRYCVIRDAVVENLRSNSCDRSLNQQKLNYLKKYESNLPLFSQPKDRIPASYIYPTKGACRGRCVIFSIDVFHPILCLPKRSGSEVDVINISKAFENLDFKVSVYLNLTANDLFSTMKLGMLHFL